MEDPLEALTCLSLITRNLPIKNNQNDDLEDIHDFMKSMAKTTVDNSKELQNPEFASFLTGNNEHEAVAAYEKEIRRERRPGLGRKKAQFTMIPKLSQPLLSSQPISDKELSKDPDKFFAYYERREMAEKELKRLRGEIVSDAIDIEFNLPRPERQRRPGLLGRTATYKHLYPSSTLPQINDPSMSSQETLQEELLNPVSRTSLPEAVNSRVESEKKLTGSIATSESKFNTLFDELLGRKELDGDEISSLVLDRLQIKRTIMNEIPIPVFQVSRKDTNSRTALSNIQNLPQMVSGKALAKDKQVSKILSKSLASPRPSLSPLAPISAFQKHIQQSNDRFSALNLSPPRNSSSLGDVDEKSNHLDTSKELMASSSSELKSLLFKANDSTIDNLVSLERITDEKDLQCDESVKDQFRRAEVSNMTVRSTDADFGVEADNEIVNNMLVDDVGEEAMLSAQADVIAESSARLHTNFQTSESKESHEKVEIMSRNAEPYINDNLAVDRMKNKGHKADLISPAAAGPSQNSEVIPVQHTQNMDESSEVHQNQTTIEIPLGKGRKRKEVCPTQSFADVPGKDQGKGEIHTRKGLRRKEAKEPLEVPLNDQTNGAPRPKTHKKKEFSRRNSLAAAGSQWEEGIRRSNRIAVKPLKYWKGERFLYGRVHESLATVIGLKYDSPEKGAEFSFEDKRNLKVKSYVSGEFEELVKRRALY